MSKKQQPHTGEQSDLLRQRFLQRKLEKRYDTLSPNEPLSREGGSGEAHEKGRSDTEGGIDDEMSSTWQVRVLTGMGFGLLSGVWLAVTAGTVLNTLVWWEGGREETLVSSLGMVSAFVLVGLILGVGLGVLRKPAFTDPQTKQGIPSTGIARVVGGVVAGVPWFAGFLVLFFLVGLTASYWGAGWQPLENLVSLWVSYVLLGVLFCGPYLMFLEPENCRKSEWGRWAHDTIARRQHLRRSSRILRSQEHVNVPDTAISRAQPPGEPQPTDAALSLADTTEEKDRLPASMDTSTAEEEVPVKGD